MKPSPSKFLGFCALLALFFGRSSTSGQLTGYTAINAFPGLNFSEPVCIVAPPGETNRLFILEKHGLIIVITNLVNPTRTVFLDISGRVDESSEELGLLGLAFHPDYATNRRFFVFYTGSATNGTTGSHEILSRFQTSIANPNQGDTNSEVRLIAQYDQANNHNAGDLHFGPDGYLYVSLGDEGGGDDSFNNSQRIDNDFFSGILRIDVDKLPGSLPPNSHPASSTNYTIPSDNPFVGTTSFNGSAVNPNNVRTEFWAVGLRNPWRYSFDPQTGLLYCGDVGQGAREEVDIITKGGNYGWAFREGTIAGPKFGSAPGGFTSMDPILDYSHGLGFNQGNVIIGGVVYRGSRFLNLFGYYVYADSESGNVWALKYDGTNVTSHQTLFGDAGLAAFGVDPANGDVLCANLNNSTIQRIVTLAPTGSLQVTIDPVAAISAGAKWQLNGGLFQNTGATISNLAVGDYTVAFKAISGWNTPTNHTVTINSNDTTLASATYTIIDTARPTLAITSPKSGLRATNANFTATGTAKDNVAVAVIYFQLNSNAWAIASGTTNWTASLTLTPGQNTIRAYTVDTSGKISKTNIVSFVYVVTAPLLVQIVGSGKITPDLSAKLSEIGKSYSMTAKASKGFAFSNWSGSLSSSKTKLSFVMASNLTFTATFVDAQDPVNIINFPAVNMKLTNSALTVTGKASDNVGVTSVSYQLNGAEWNAAITTNGWTNWVTAALIPNSGANLASAWAADAAGNISKTNSVKFTYLVVASADWAPDNLSGLSAVATPDSETPSFLSFDAATFSQTGATTNDEFSVGQYTYLKLGTNTAQLMLTNTAPPRLTNAVSVPIDLIFTNHYSGIFTNEEGSGAINFFIETNPVPASLSGKKIIAISSNGTKTNTVTLKRDGNFAETVTGHPDLSNTGTYTFIRYSPNGAILKLTLDNGVLLGNNTAYFQLKFTSKTAGTYFVTSFVRGLLVPYDVDLGTFTLH